MGSNSVKTQYYVQVDEKKQTVKALKVHETTKGEFYYKQRNGRDYQNIFVKKVMSTVLIGTTAKIKVCPI